MTRTENKTGNESETVTADDGVRLWVGRSGTGGTPLVLCHGGPGLWDMFGDVAGYLSEKRPAAPRSSRRPELNDRLPSHLWQGVIAVAAPSAPELIVLQMVPPDLDSADNYRNMLLGIARTLAFTDPERATSDSRM